MIYTIKPNNYKMQLNPPTPIQINAPSSISIPQLSQFNIELPNNQPIDPAIIQQVREMSNMGNIVTPNPNPRIIPSMKTKSGLLFRDILGRAAKTENCGGCEGKK